MFLVASIALGASLSASAQPASSAPDVLVLSNGDTLHGNLIDAANGEVAFHSDSLGKVTVKWSGIRELRTRGKFAVLSKSAGEHSRKSAARIPVGTIEVIRGTVTVREPDGVTAASIPVADAAYIVKQSALDQQVYHRPNFLTGWNGAATAGATIVKATQNQYTASGSIGLVRTVPGVAWLNPRNRTSIDFSGSFGKITEPGTATVKTAIFHADGERDEYISARFFGIGQAAFDHNFSQGLALQSVYGGGVGYTVLNEAKQELDVKATIQYESQQFITPAPPAAGTASRNLIGSTFAATYLLKLKRLSFAQTAAFVPAYNTPSAYSANETNTISFPTYKNFGFSVGTLDSYLNDPPISTPPTKANSFQFTMGLTYAIKSKY